MASQHTLLVILAMGWAFAVASRDSTAPTDSPLRTPHLGPSAGDRPATLPGSIRERRCGLEIPSNERAPIDDDTSLSDQRPQFSFLSGSGFPIGRDPGSADASARFAFASALAAEKPRSHAIRAP
jgi:hypothetical protein